MRDILDSLSAPLEDYPPAGEVPWRVWTLAPERFREDEVKAHSWFEARQKAATLFHVLFQHVEATRRDVEDQPVPADLSMNRVA